jgi:hypothetical protein
LGHLGFLVVHRPTVIPEHLLAPYYDTIYRADTPHGPLDIRIGERSARLDALLRSHGALNWAFISAQNPRSQRCSETANERRYRALLLRVEELGFSCFTGRGISAAGDWPAEESLLIIGIPLAAAQALGRSFGQLAIVAGELGGSPQLIDCTDEQA